MRVKRACVRERERERNCVFFQCFLMRKSPGEPTKKNGEFFGEKKLKPA